MGKGNNTKAFTLVELLTVIVLFGLIITLAIPTLRNLTYNSAEKEYQYHQQLVHEAAKLYAKNYRGELDSSDSSCFNIPYSALLQEDLIEEENTKCSGNIILEKRGRDGYNYNYYLTCKDISGEVLHESDPIPLSCKGMNGSFKVNYQLYQDGESGRVPYTEGDWTKYVYGEYNASSPYNYPIDYFEYSIDFINWTKIDDHTQTYTNYVGNVFVRAVDKGENVSDVMRHLVRTDSLGPTFTLKSNENEISANNLISVSVDNVKDVGVGIDELGNTYSIDGVNWSSNSSWDFPLNSNLTVYIRDRLGNVSSQEAQIIRACNGRSGTVKAEDIVAGKTLWVNGEKITGTMTDNGAINRALNPGDTFTIPVGYHNGEGRITVSSMLNNTSATATSDQILSGKSAWVNGEKVVGIMRNSSQGNKTLNSGDNYVLNLGYHDGKQTIRVKTIAEQTEGNTTADNLPLGETAWVNGTQVVGTGADKNSWHQQGVEDGNNRCTAKLSNMKSSVKFIYDGVQTQTFTYTVATTNYTKLSIGSINTVSVDNYSIELACSGSTNRTITASANQVIDITPYNSVTVTIKIEKNARLDEIPYMPETRPQIMISYMNFD